MNEVRILRLLLYLILLTLPLGQFGRVPVPAVLPDVNIYLNDLLLPLLITLWLVYKLGIRRSLKLPPLWGWLAAFFGVALISLINGWRWVTPWQWLVGGLYLLRWVEYVMLYWIAYDLVKIGEIKERRVIKILIGVIGVFALVGLLQFVLFPDFSKYVQHGWDPHYYRVLSTFFDPNFAGIFLVMGFLLVTAVVLGGKKDGSDRRVKLEVTGTLLLVAILLTFSRSTYLALIVGVSVLGLLRSRRLLTAFLILGMISILFIPRVRTRVAGIIRPDVTARLRIKDWQKTLTIIQKHPILGVGFNTFRYAQEREGLFRDERGVPRPSGHAGAGADSSLLFLWATTGIFGLVIYLGLLTNVWLRAKGGIRGVEGIGEEESTIALALVAIIPAWVVHAQFVNSLFYPWVMELAWMLLALL